MSYFQKRYTVFTIIFFLVAIIPFITINDNHLLLLYIVKQEFHFLGTVFTVQELHLMPFLIMFLFVGVFAISSLLGRFWCGWFCPQTILRFIFRDVIQTFILRLRKDINNKQREPDMSLFVNKIKYAVSFLIFFAIAFIVASNFLLYFVPPEYFFSAILDITNHKVLALFMVLISLSIISLVVFLKENFCIYVCPYARVQSILYDKHTFTAVYSNIRGGYVYKDRQEQVFSKKDFLNNEECILCQKCVKVCPTNIDIRKGLQIECIECLSCVDACTKVMKKQNKPSLIQWTSDAIANENIKTNIFRIKSISYGVALIAILGMLYIVSSKKEQIKLNINRTSQLYSIKENSIQNAYIFLFYNTTSKKHKCYFKINNQDIKITRPKKPFTLSAKEKLKKAVALKIDKTTLKQLKGKYEDGIIKISINVYCLDDKEINTKRDSIFAFPK